MKEDDVYVGNSKCGIFYVHETREPIIKIRTTANFCSIQDAKNLRDDINRLLPALEGEHEEWMEWDQAQKNKRIKEASNV